MENSNNNKWWILILGIVAALIAVFVIIWLVNMNSRDDIIIDDDKTTYDLLMETDKTYETEYVKSYYLNYDGTRVVIYSEPEREFYDYADINMEVLPPEIREQLKLGMYIDGENNLYDFLQTYSS